MAGNTPLETRTCSHSRQRLDATFRSIFGTARYISDMPSAEPSGRASPPTKRVVAVLDFLAGHPHDRFGVSELARRLGLSKPTCLGIVTALTESDYLVRDSQDKTYRLGPALIALGHSAQESLRVGPAA